MQTECNPKEECSPKEDREGISKCAKHLSGIDTEAYTINQAFGKLMDYFNGDTSGPSLVYTERQAMITYLYDTMPPVMRRWLEIERLKQKPVIPHDQGE